MNRTALTFVAGILGALALFAIGYSLLRGLSAPSPTDVAGAPSKPLTPTLPLRLDLDDCRGEVLYTFATAGQRIRNTGGCAFSDMHLTAPLNFEVRYCIENRQHRRCRADDPRSLTDTILVQPNGLASLAPYGIISIALADQPSTISFKLSLPGIDPSHQPPSLPASGTERTVYVCTKKETLTDFQILREGFSLTFANGGLRCGFSLTVKKGEVRVTYHDGSYMDFQPKTCTGDYALSPNCQAANRKVPRTISSISSSSIIDLVLEPR